MKKRRISSAGGAALCAVQRARALTFLVVGLSAGTAFAAEPEAVQAALVRLEQETGAAPRVVWSRDRLVPSLITDVRMRVTGPTPEARAEAFLARFEGLIGFSRDHLRVEAIAARAHRTYVRFQQRVGELDVEGGRVTVGLEGDRVVSVANDARTIEVIEGATISRESARRLALEFVHGGPTSAAIETTQIASHGLSVVGARAVEVYRVFVLRRPFVEHLEVLVDAHAGRVIGMTDRSVR